MRKRSFVNLGIAIAESMNTPAEVLAINNNLLPFLFKGTGTSRCMIDGNSVDFNNELTYCIVESDTDIQQLFFNGILPGGQAFQFHLYLQGVLAKGIYNMWSSNDIVCTIAVYKPTTNTLYEYSGTRTDKSYECDGSSTTITIEEITSTKIIGTYSFTLVHQLDPAKNVIITNGQFNFDLVPQERNEFGSF